MATTDFTTFVPPVGTSLTTTALTTVYTARKTYANAVSIWLTNRSAAAVAATVTWFDNDTASSFDLCFEYPVPANGMLILEPRGFGLDVGDELRVTAGTANKLHCIVSTVEIAGRVL